MWLVNVKTLKLEEIWGEESREYAILSHRWEDEEVIFKDMQNLEIGMLKKGFKKLQNACKRAMENNYDYLWMDTCCINKESSAELSEAINSTFRWYKAAAVCYAFLSDVVRDRIDPAKPQAEIQKSVWFDRGWTLQELLAPNDVWFFDQQWKVLGTRNSTLTEILEQRTGISREALSGRPLTSYSIAQRMSWASRRVTTRREDVAYCLLGIFDVNMPMLYGEAEKAFMRLQEEIIKKSDDHTIFAWPNPEKLATGLLATSPAAFKDCQALRPVVKQKGHFSFTMTNRGLSCTFLAEHFFSDTYLVSLDCTNDTFNFEPTLYWGTLQPGVELCHQRQVGIFLRRLNEEDQYARVTYKAYPTVQIALTTYEGLWGLRIVSEDLQAFPPKRSFR